MTTKQKPIFIIDKGELVLNTKDLNKKQQRNLVVLANQGMIRTAGSYLDNIVNKRKSRSGLSDFKELRENQRYNASALTIHKSNRIIKLFEKQFDVTSQKLPKAITEGEAIGVEIEFYVPIAKIEAYNDNGCDCDDEDCSEHAEGSFDKAQDFFNKECLKRRIKGVSIGTDASIDNPDELEYMALEARILTKVGDLSNLERFCALLVEKGAKVNVSCGLHTHLDCRNYDRRPAAIVKRLAKALPLLKAMLPKSRIGNTYCETDVGSEGRSSRGTRYACINDAEAFAKFKTIEVRMHSGTINFTKISNWITILRSIALTESQSNLDVTIEAYAAKLGWSAQLVSYVVSRIQKFNPDSSFLGTGNENPLPSQAMLDPSHEDSEAAA